MTAPLQLEADTTFAGRFRIRRVVTRVAGATMYGAVDGDSSAECVLWVFEPRVAEGADRRAAFSRAVIDADAGDAPARIVARDAGVDLESNAPWIAYESLRGESLANVLANQGMLHATEFLPIVRLLGSTLGTLHGRGHAHGALAPEFVFLQPAATPTPESAYELRLLCAGLPASPSSARTLWLAPEQARGEVATPRSDVWSLGLLAYELLTGHAYWDADGSPKWRRAPPDVDLALAPLEPATTRARVHGAAPFLPTGFDAWFSKCVNRDSASRFADGPSATRELSALLEASVAPAYRAPRRPRAEPVIASAGPISDSRESSVSEPMRPASLPPPPERAQVAPRRDSSSATPRPSSAGGRDETRPSFANPPSDPGLRQSIVEEDRRSDPRNVGGRRSEALIAQEPLISSRASQTSLSRGPTRPPPRTHPVLIALVSIAVGAGVGVPIGRATVRRAGGASPGVGAGDCPDREFDSDIPDGAPWRNVPAGQAPVIDDPGTSDGGGAASVDDASAPMPSALTDASVPVANAGTTARPLTVQSTGGGRIFDNHTTTASAVVNDSCTIGRLQVQVRGNHSFASDMVVRLRNPAGVVQVLQTHASRTPFRRYDVIRFDNTDARGTWTLSILDDVGADSGTLAGFTMNLTCR